jgi:hypothetical protein
MSPAHRRFGARKPSAVGVAKSWADTLGATGSVYAESMVRRTLTVPPLAACHAHKLGDDVFHLVVLCPCRELDVQARTAVLLAVVVEQLL